MSKSKPKTFNRGWNDYDEDDYGDSRQTDRERRKEKRLKNLIRSKNYEALMELEEDEE